MLLISEDLDEIRALADRIVVMYEGTLAGELDAATATVEEIGLLDGRGPHRVRFERRLEQPRWLLVAVPIGSIVLAFVLMAFVLVLTGHDPASTYRRLFDSAFFADGALTSTLVFCTPILFTGLAAAAAFRMQLYNIGGEGQFYWGAIAAVGVALYLGDRGVELDLRARRRDVPRRRARRRGLGRDTGRAPRLLPRPTRSSPR